MDKLLKLIEESSLQLVMVDETDLQGLARIHSQFEALGAEATAVGTEAQGAHWQVVASASRAAAKLIEKIILADVEDLEQTMAAVSEGAKAMQVLIEALVEGRQVPGVTFPDLLGIAPPVVGSDSVGGAAGAAPAATGATSDRQTNLVRITLPDNVDEDIFREYLAGQPDVLESLESAILAAEQDASREHLDSIKGILHNMKGESGLMGLDEISRVCHEAESLLEDDAGPFPGEKLLAAKDWLQTAITGLREGRIVFDKPGTAGEVAAPEAPVAVADSAGLYIAEGDVPLVMDFINESTEHLEAAENDLLTIEDEPDNDEKINGVFRAFHTIKGVAGFLNLEHIATLAHVTENLLDLARKGNLTLTGASIDAVFEAVDLAKKMLGTLRDAVDKNEPVTRHPELGEIVTRIRACADGETPPPRLGQVLVDQGAASRNDVRAALAEQQAQGGQPPVGEILVDHEVVSAEQVAQAAQVQQGAARDPGSGRKANTDATVKVTTGRLDALINMVGELVIAQSMVSRDVAEADGDSQRLERNLRHLDKITRDLQELSMSMRMVPVHGVFQKMARLVRDLSRKAGKNIELHMSGSETELDRNVVEAIADPLVHMVRNSVDHGVETPDQRLQAGKSPTGRIELRAFHQAGNICIEIADDGRGLNRERIIKKAVENGLIREGQELSDKDIYGLIFHAGLSTAEKVTDISGRGVGMDVVRKNIEALRGRIEVESTAGKGTTISIALPLTLAVIDGQTVTVGNNSFIVPTLSIEQSLRPNREQFKTVQGGQGEMMLIRGQLIPLLRLHRLFNIEPRHENPSDGLVVVVVDGEQRCCLQVDNLLGQQQVVIKSLGEYLGSVRGVAGGAIMGDGAVSLILDVPGLIKLAAEQ